MFFTELQYVHGFVRGAAGGSIHSTMEGAVVSSVDGTAHGAVNSTLRTSIVLGSRGRPRGIKEYAL